MFSGFFGHDIVKTLLSFNGSPAKDETGCAILTSKAKAFAGKAASKVFKKAKKKPFLHKCSWCKSGNLHRIAVFDQRDPPAWYLSGSQNTSPCKS